MDLNPHEDMTTRNPEGLYDLVDDRVIDQIANNLNIEPEQVTDEMIQNYVDDQRGDGDMEVDYNRG